MQHAYDLHITSWRCQTNKHTHTHTHTLQGWSVDPMEDVILIHRFLAARSTVRLSESLAIGKSFSLVWWSPVVMVTAQASVVILLSLHLKARGWAKALMFRGWLSTGSHSAPCWWWTTGPKQLSRVGMLTQWRMSFWHTYTHTHTHISIHTYTQARTHTNTHSIFVCFVLAAIYFN